MMEIDTALVRIFDWFNFFFGISTSKSASVRNGYSSIKIALTSVGMKPSSVVFLGLLDVEAACWKCMVNCNQGIGASPATTCPEKMSTSRQTQSSESALNGISKSETNSNGKKSKTCVSPTAHRDRCEGGKLHQDGDATWQEAVKVLISR